MTPHDLDRTRPDKALNYAMELLDEDSLRDALRDYGLHEATRKIRRGATSPGRPGYASAAIESPAPGPRVTLLATDVSGGDVPAGRVSLSATFGVYASAWTVTTSLTGDPAVDEDLLLAALAALNLYFWTFHPEDAEDLTGRTRAAAVANRAERIGDYFNLPTASSVSVDASYRAAGQEPSPADLLGRVARIAEAPILSISEDELRDLFREED